MKGFCSLIAIYRCCVHHSGFAEAKENLFFDTFATFADNLYKNFYHLTTLDNFSIYRVKEIFVLPVGFAEAKAISVYRLAQKWINNYDIISSMVKVKICGITNLDDALAAADFGADALGFVFFKKSPRYISVSNARSIIEKLPPYITPVGLFVNETKKNIEKTVQQTGITTIQLHGDEPPKSCSIKGCKIIKAIRIASDESLELFKKYSDIVSAFLLDTHTEKLYGGTAETFNWDIALKTKKFGKIILAGGLTPENVREAIIHVQPFAVDVSSGVEKKKGEKDHKKMQLFIERSKRIGFLL